MGAIDTKTITKNASFGEDIFDLDFNGNLSEAGFFARSSVFLDKSAFGSLVYGLLEFRDKFFGLFRLLG